jgi:VWFA-related protein
VSRPRFLFAFLIAAAVIRTAAAQSHQEQITVNVVEVPVWVSRFDGKPVRDLTAADFELFVNGRPQAIEYFDVLVEDTKAAPVVAERAVERPDLHRRRLYLLLFDLTTLSLDHMRKARAAALRFVAEAPAGDTFAVATLRITGIHFAAPFTTDRVAVERAIRTLSASRAGDAFNLATLETERVTAGGPAPQLPSPTQWDAPGVGPMVGFQGPAQALTEAADSKRREIEAAAAGQVRERAIQNLAALAGSLAPLSGVKHVLLVSEGQPTEMSVLDEGPSGSVRYIAEVHERYRAAGVTLNALDVRPHVPWTGPSGKFETNTGGLMKDAQLSLKTLAGGTGGSVVHNLDALREQHSVTYILGFRPSPAEQQKENAIRVKVKNQAFGTFLRHRQSYSIERPRTKDGEGLFLADVLVNDIAQNGMTVSLDVKPEGEEVLLAASIPGQEVLGYGGKDGATLLDVYLYVFDESAVVAWWTHVRLRVDLELGREFLSTNPYTIRQQIRLGPGRYSGKALIRVLGQDATGFRRTDFTIP